MGGKNKGKTKQVDEAWEHCVKVDGNKLKCLRCGNSYSCTITRIKHHLAQTNKNIAPCKNVSDEVCERFKQKLRELNKKKDVVEEGECSTKKKRGPCDISYGCREDLVDEENNNNEINMPPILQSQPVQQNNQKGKGPSSSGAANSTGTGNTVGPSPNSQPSTPSTHTPGDGVAMANNLQNVSGMLESMMYSADGAGGLASSRNQLLQEHMDQFGDFDYDLDCDGDGRDLFGTLKQNPEHATEPSKGFSFNEVSCLGKSTNKVNCCHFSSDGKLLASSGDDKKVVLWNMDTGQTDSTPEYHTTTITDVRFRPNSTQLATSSCDTTIRLWDAVDPSYSIRTYKGHTSTVMSLDFHPKKTDRFCSCDNNNEMRYWKITRDNSTHVSRASGGLGKVRFQPRIGQFMAAVSGSIVSIYDVENDRQTHSLQGHSRDVSCLSWDTNGDRLASVCQNSVRVWSLNSGEFIREFNSSGNSFYSCVFHPIYSNLLVIGGYQTLEVWNLDMNKPVSVQAHECQITAMAVSPATRMVASVSYDNSVKFWSRLF